VSEKEEINQPWQYFLVAFTQMLMLPFTYICIRRMIAKTWKWFNIWNAMETITQVIQVTCTVVYLLGTYPPHFEVLLATQVILLIVRIQFFARYAPLPRPDGRRSVPRAFVAVDSSMLDTLKAVVGSIRWYLLLLVLTVYSFACAFHILFRSGYKECAVRLALCLGHYKVIYRILIPLCTAR